MRRDTQLGRVAYSDFGQRLHFTPPFLNVDVKSYFFADGQKKPTYREEMGLYIRSFFPLSTSEGTRTMRGEMEQVPPRETPSTAGRRLCHPYALSALFLTDDACRGLPEPGSALIRWGASGGSPLYVSPFTVGDVVREGESLLLLRSGGGTHRVGLPVGNSNICTWYDSGWGFAMRCRLDVLPRPESLDLAMVAPTEGGAHTVHSHPPAKTPLGGRGSKTNPYAEGGPTSIKRLRLVARAKTPSPESALNLQRRTASNMAPLSLRRGCSFPLN